MDKQSLKEVLRVISQTIDALSQKQIDALFAGKGQLVFASSETPQETPSSPPAARAQAASRPAPERAAEPAAPVAQAAPEPALEKAHAEDQPTQPPAKAKKTKTSAKPAAPVDLGDLWARLGACRDRAEAKKLLKTVRLTGTLKDLGRMNSVSMPSTLNRAGIEDKLIEFTVGSRLRREAIHSLDLRETRRPEGD